MLFGSLFGRRGVAAAPALPTDGGSADAALLEAVVAGMPDAAIVLDRDTRVIAFNAAARVIAPALARDRKSVV